MSLERDLVGRLALVVGFLALAGSTIAAHRQPATGYELSILTATSPVVWAGLLTAMTIALGVTFSAGISRWSCRLALVLGGLTTTVYAGLPLIRGYRFYGHHDALTHLGWARGLGDGSIGPFELFYPGIHSMTVVLTSALEIPLSQAMLLTVLLTAVVFTIFIPLTVRRITDDDGAVTIAAFAGFLLLPITTISMYLTAHSMSQAVFLTALFVYLLILVVRTDRRGWELTGLDLAFAVVAVALVVYHPQLVAHLIVVCCGITAVQFVARRIDGWQQIADHAPIYAHTGFVIGIFLLWTANHGFFTGTMVHFGTSVVDFLTGEGGTPAQSVAAQGDSVTAVGGTILETFFRLFAAHVVFGLLVVGLLLAMVRGESAWLERIRPETTYFTAGLLGLVPVFFVYLFAPGSSMYFRVFGLMMVFVTLLGSLGLATIGVRVASRVPERSATAQEQAAADGGRVGTGHPVFGIVFAVLLVVSLVAVLPTPYTYTASPQVSHTTMDGYETTFSYQDDDVDFLGLRDGPNRFDDALHSNAERSWVHQDVPPEAFRNGLTDHYDDHYYLTVATFDEQRETIAYHELRYTAGDFDAIDAEPGVNRIGSNGDLETYAVHGEPGDWDTFD